jgi:hypothetical protein
MSLKRRAVVRIEMGFDGLGHRHPRVYRLARPPWRLLLRRLGWPTYGG